MNLSNDFINLDECLAELTGYTGDRAFKNGLSKGWYIARLKDALIDIKYDTLMTKIPFDLKMPENRILVVPVGFFNVDQVYVFNGESCTPEGGVPVIWKRNYNSIGDTSMVANQHVSTHYPDSGISATSTLLYWEQVDIDTMNFSPACGDYTGVRLIGSYNGVKCDENLRVPRFLKSYLVAKAELAFMRIQRNRNPRVFRTSLVDQVQLVDKYEINAKWNIKRADKAKLRDLITVHKHPHSTRQ